MGAVKNSGGGLSELGLFPQEAGGAVSEEDVPGDSAADAAPAAASFSQLRDDTRSRYAVTPKGTFHLTPTELQLVCVIEELDGRPVSRAALAAHLHRNTTVIGRLLSRLRREGVIQSEAIYQENGGQTANRWLIAPGVRPLAEGERP